MKIYSLSFLAFICAVAFARGGSFVYETAKEFHSTGDFDGDGRQDQVIVDQTTGTYRIGYQLAVDAFTWTEPRGSGLTNITGAAVGKLLPPSAGVVPRDAVALTSGPANRLVLCGAENPLAATPAVDVFPSSRGTFTLVALEAAGPSNDPVYEDLLAVSWWNGSPNVQFETIRGGATHPTDGISTFFDAWGAGNPAKLKTTGDVLAGFISRNDPTGTGRFRFYSASTFPVQQATNNLFVAEEAFWAAGFFGGASLATVLEYERGTNQLHTHAVTEAGVTFTLQPAVSYTMQGTIDLVVVLEGPSDTRLLLILDKHQAMQVLDFDGVNAPVVAMTLYAPPGLEFTGANAVSGGHLQLFSGPIGSGTATQFDYYKRSGTSYALQQTGSLSAPGLQSGRRNLLLFTDEPFVDPDATLLASIPSGDWTSDIGDVSGNLLVTLESFLSSTAGLGNPLSSDLGAPPAGAQWAMPDQYRSDVSVFNLQGNPAGVPSVSVSPPGGYFTRAVQLQFSASQAGDVIHYRTGMDQPWGMTSNTGPLLSATTTLQFYAQRGTTKSPIITASYRFPSPEKLDSDGDGVPDFVELARGLNPLGGSDNDEDGTDDLTELLDGTNPSDPNSPLRLDSDGDGFSDAQELAAGTNPNDPTSLPPLRGGFYLEAIARLYANCLPSGRWPVAGTLITARMCDALPLATAATTDYFFNVHAGAKALFPTVNPALESPLVVLSTPSVFLSNGTPPVQGAELISVVPTPLNVDPAAINYVPGNGPPSVEADDWITAAQTARAAYVQPAAFVTMSPLHTMSALLVEEKLRQIFTARSIPDGQRLTLFAFSAADERCVPLTPEQGSDPAPVPLSAPLLATVAQQQSAVLPGYDVRQMITLITTEVQSNAAPEIEALRKLACDLFEKFEAHSPLLVNGAPNPAALQYGPVNMLRCFLAGNPLPADYLAVTSLTPSEFTAAAAAPALILAMVQARATRTATLTVTATSFGQTTLLNEPSVPQVVGLVTSEGDPWQFPHGVPPAAGGVMEVLGYTDAPVPAGAAAALEVISVNVLSLPDNAAGPDSDEDTLADAWELAFFGSLTQNGAGDFDTDGANNATEFLAGTDPSQSGGSPLPAPLALGIPVPQLEIAQPEAGLIMLGWSYPANIASAVQFSVECSPDLDGTGFLSVPATIYQAQPGSWIARIVQTEPNRCFFRLRITQR